MGKTELDLLLRALASPTRLSILSILMRSGAGTAATQPSSLAAALKVSPSSISQHLKHLLRVGLVRYWKKGCYKSYAPARFSGASVRSRLLDRLRDELPKNTTPVPVARTGRG